MQKRTERPEMPEMIKTYARGFLVMGGIVAVLSLIAVCMYIRDTAAASSVMGIMPV